MEVSIENKEVLCDCVVCKHHHDVTIPRGLIEDFMNGNVVIFAGAGISTEGSLVLQATLYENICAEINQEDKNLSFPDAMSMYADQHNGRIKLLSKIKSRFQYIDSFPELRKNATRFHEELSTFYPIDTIVTTNWDRYFEEECGATAFTSSEDVAFWESPGRKVLKIHGSIDNYGSIVATTTDYESCEERLSKGIIGSILKVLLATKTIVYCGYSLRDDDFKAINSFVKNEMKSLNRHAYIVTPFVNEGDYDAQAVIPIKTDATFFIQTIKEHALVELKDHFLPDIIYGAAGFMLNVVTSAHAKLHEKYNCHDNPEIVLCASYQDGLLHAFERVLAMRKTGHYSHACEIRRVLKPYENYRKDFLKNKRYDDVAYIDGYTNGLMFVLSSEDLEIVEYFPLFYAFGSGVDLVSFEDYVEIADEIPSLHKSAYKRARQVVSKQLKYGDDVEFHHFPWL